VVVNGRAKAMSARTKDSTGGPWYKKAIVWDNC
jgi:hypothetical protein